MPDDVRINLHLPAAAREMVDQMCRERGMTKAALVRQALGVFQIVHNATREGHYVGTAKDRERLDTVIISSL